MTNKVKKLYSSYNHISNGGITIGVKVSGDGEHAIQRLHLEVTNFGVPLETALYLNSNVIDALEYIIDKAKEQRKAFGIGEYDAIQKFTKTE